MEQIWLAGTLSPPCASSYFVAQFDFHSVGVKVGVAPRGSEGVLLCLSSLVFQRECSCLVDIPLSHNMISFTTTPPHPILYHLSSSLASFSLVLKLERGIATIAAHTASAIESEAIVWQIPRHFTVQWLSQDKWGKRRRRRRRSRGGEGYTGRRHLVSPGRDSVCSLRGCIDWPL